MIYTSYFAQLRNLSKDIIPISICGKAPNWYNGYEYKRVAPNYNILMKYKQDYNEQDYIKNFNEQILNNITINEFVNDLIKLLEIEKGQKVNICLLCYEKPTDFCHRHLVSKWLNENGFKCEEWRKEIGRAHV